LIEQGLTSPTTQYRLSERHFYRSKDPTNSIKVLKAKNATKVIHRPWKPYPRTKHEVYRIIRCGDMAICVSWRHMEPSFWGNGRP